MKTRFNLTNDDIFNLTLCAICFVGFVVFYALGIAAKGVR